mmetsp:Transcript_33789/g.69434  ORF Transcript_33789/g.69434 Transcript_33789/m.69434 type:complete len:288 (-) Transcript_33789:274-1137(-)
MGTPKSLCFSHMLVVSAMVLGFSFPSWKRPPLASRPPQTQMQKQRRDHLMIAETLSQPQSLFDKGVSTTYFRDVCQNNQKNAKSSSFRGNFNLSEWDQQTKGGLVDNDRIMLAKYYSGANSVFEWGLGESSYIAGHLNVTRYSGVDSDANWVSAARDKCPSHFRLYFADIGKTESWGNPVEKLPKTIYDYVLSPLHLELCPFDVYMVDGRFRVACALMALLHASRHDHDATILMHDYTGKRKNYLSMERVCDVVEFSGSKLVALKRKPDVTDEAIYEMYLEASRSRH